MSCLLIDYLSSLSANQRTAQIPNCYVELEFGRGSQHLYYLNFFVYTFHLTFKLPSAEMYLKNLVKQKTRKTLNGLYRDTGEIHSYKLALATLIEEIQIQ